MKKVILLLASVVLLFGTGYSQEMSKEEKARLREELKIYMSDLAGYKAKKADIQATLDSNDAVIKDLKEQLVGETGMRNKIESYEAEVIKYRTENEQLKAFNDQKAEETVSKMVEYKLDSILNSMPRNETAENNGPSGTSGKGNDSKNRNDGSTSSNKGKKGKSGTGNSDDKSITNNSGNANDSNNNDDDNSGSNSGNTGSNKTVKNKSKKSGPGNVTADNTSAATPSEGTIYKIQIGLYKKFNINRYFEDLKYIGYETVDGKNRYVIGYFNDENMAQEFVKDIRKMGIKDAFVSKYVDGKRVYEKP